MLEKKMIRINDALIVSDNDSVEIVVALGIDLMSNNQYGLLVETTPLHGFNRRVITPEYFAKNNRGLEVINLGQLDSNPYWGKQ